MEWYFVLLSLFAILVFLMITGVPVAFAFMIANVAAFIFFFGLNGIDQLTNSIFSVLASFVLLPIPLFILMGDVLFRTGIGPALIRTIDKWMGRLPGRLSLLAVAAGVLFAALTGTGLASTAILGSVLAPDMVKQGYKKDMILGPIMAGGGLAHMIPPSALAVLIGAIGQISVGKILMGIIFPGLLMAALYAAYIILRCWLQPSLAPIYQVARVTVKEKIGDTVKYVIPQGFVIFLVIGIVFLGVATPSEAAATGAMGSFILALCYGRLNWKVTREIVVSTLATTGMIFFILAGANAFSQMLAFSGATSGLARLATDIQVSPIVIVIAMQVVLIILGMFIDPFSMMMVTCPIFLPVIITLGLDTVWFAVLFLINIAIAGLTPPFGMLLFVMQGVAPPGTTMGEVIKSGLPFIVLNLIALALVLAFPIICLWLPLNMG